MGLYSSGTSYCCMILEKWYKNLRPGNEALRPAASRQTLGIFRVILHHIIRCRRTALNPPRRTNPLGHPKRHPHKRHVSQQIPGILQLPLTVILVALVKIPSSLRRPINIKPSLSPHPRSSHPLQRPHLRSRHHRQLHPHPERPPTTHPTPRTPHPPRPHLRSRHHRQLHPQQERHPNTSHIPRTPQRPVSRLKLVTAVYLVQISQITARHPASKTSTPIPEHPQNLLTASPTSSSPSDISTAKTNPANRSQRANRIQRRHDVAHRRGVACRVSKPHRIGMSVLVIVLAHRVA